jgi:elongation factor Ts
MEVTLNLIKELREKTGAGMADCKKALQETSGDMDKAIEYLRKKGAATSAKRADRAAKEGAVKIAISDDRKSAMMIELNCETDFVSRGEGFQSFSDKLAKTGLLNKCKDVESLLASKADTTLTVKEELDSMMGSIGEKIELRRAKYFEVPEGFVSIYVHFGSKLGGMLAIEGKPTEEALDLGKKIAIQLVAMNPLALNRESVPAETMEKEKEIYMTVAKNEGKPDNIVERIVNNKLEKYYQENCLMEQEYINESGSSINDIVKRYEKSTSEKFVIKEMVRFQCGL